MSVSSAEDGRTDGMGMLTAEEWLVNKVKFEVPRKAVAVIMAERGIDGGADMAAADKDTLRLAYADLLKWLVLGPSKVNNTSDTDNGWTHSGGGYELSEADIRELKAEANAIYEELEPESALKKKCKFRIVSGGVKRANLAVGELGTGSWASLGLSKPF